ncbi:DUF2863 family protein [Glaciimonas immobilis]|uniref:DUF2863 family protein n=1 Tax=Glaciimonas immobilis TaxID=728004 RepID=A0A840RQZ7_9BURK|nr:DUF2863 family protein [Glaciimonas immobilis]KAF3999499.1 DUF2863 family protein [Glaciimonas immobilis]MBB5199020.1 hypothetical protein [Glaciimonas immobilis]
MRRPSKTPRKFSTDSHRLTELAQALVLASSRIEQRAWEHELDTHLSKLLKSHHQEPIDSALEQLFPEQADAYEALMDAVEACSESSTIEHGGLRYDTLLIAIPVLAWTRFSIASGSVPPDMVATLTGHMHAHILASDVRVALMPTLYAIDQLPRSHADTYALMHRMSQAALTGAIVTNPPNAPETAPFLADTRYLLATLVVPTGHAFFCWQPGALSGSNISASSTATKKSVALEHWLAQVTPNVSRLLPGCGIDLLLPEAYFVACREGDKQIRPVSLRAASYYLSTTLEIESKDLHVTIGRFSEQPESDRVDEYRIGFSIGQTTEIIYGVVWPLYGQEEAIEEPPDPTDIETEGQTPLEQILSLLRECGISDIQRHDELFAMEFCDDCGSPFYADPEGELVHPEMPEDAPPSGSAHFH